MKKLSCIPFIVLFCMVNSFAQENSKQKELGLLFSNLDSFGLTYRVGTPNAVWRFNSLVISGVDNTFEQDSLTNSSNSFGVNFSVGREWRKTVTETLEIRLGSGLSLGHRTSKSGTENGSQNLSTSESRNSNFGFNIVFGFNYLAGEHIVIGAEVLPGFNYSVGKSTQITDSVFGPQETESKNSGFSYGFSSNSALLSIVYKF
ncbi:MAG: hypothetical protein WAU36_04645 [Cyclobacteriaceae bacterium]